MLHIEERDAQDTVPLPFEPAWYLEAKAAREAGACTPMCHVPDDADRPDHGMQGLAALLLALACSASLIGFAAFVALF